MTNISTEVIKRGCNTNRGVVEKIVYLTFSGEGLMTATYSNKPKKRGRGLICAKIGNKNIPVAELKIRH